MGRMEKGGLAGYFPFYNGKDSCFVERADTFPATPGIFPASALKPDSCLAKVCPHSHIGPIPGTSGSCLNCINKNLC